MENTERIKQVYQTTVQLGREVARLEEAVRQAEFKLRLGRRRLEVVEADLLELLPVKTSTTKARLTFALASTATAEAILESLSTN
jgi:outer membrane protein TolC